MASFPPTQASTTAAGTITSNSRQIFSKTSLQPPFKTRTNNQTRHLKLSCNINADDYDKPTSSSETQKLIILPKTPLTDIQINVDRRDLLLGLSGLYTSTVNFISLPSAVAAPIAAPDISKCQDANEGFQDAKNTIRGKACCPPLTKKLVKKFVFPNDKAIRLRPAAHRVSADYIKKYSQAIKAMRDLPDDHPHSYIQQARIHCAYCNGSYTQSESGFPDKELQIHNSWLFFPFHRWYLYFYERILGKLINDPTFALPYWNWDNPAGMSIPSMFEVANTEFGNLPRQNPLFDAYRDAAHLPPTIVDLDYNGSDRVATCTEQIGINLTSIYKQMVSNAGDPLSFHGGTFKAGDDPKSFGDPSIGTIEAGCHIAVHRWVGDPRLPNNEDMGNFYSVAYDPLFYVHHANVDRMWTIWKGLKTKGHTDPADPDWQNASFVFYDENEELVRVYNRDCVDNQRLKYDYERSDTPWLKSRPVARKTKSNIATNSAGKVKKVKDVKFPLSLDKITKVLVKRPVKSRSKEDKEKAIELLLIKGIKFDSEKFVKFDVYVNDEDDVAASSAAESEFAGSFAQLPRNHSNSADKMMFLTSAVRFGLTELLEDIEAEEDESVLVSLVPKAGCEDVTISEIKIELLPIA